MSNSYNNRDFVFIVGRGRSGTTLLTRMLNMHSNICIPPEALFIIYLASKYNNKTLDESSILMFYKDIWLEKRLINWHLNKYELRNRLLNIEKPVNYNRLCKSIYLQYAVQNGKNGNIVLGDKNPLYSIYLKKLIALFPDAKFIHIMRDPRDNVLSYKNVKFDTNNTAALAYRWKHYNNNIIKFKNKYPNKFAIVKYEDLLLHPEIELEKLCQFLGLNYDNKMINFFKIINKNEKTWHKNLRNPLDKRNLYKWKTIMNNNDILIINSICSRVAQRYDYCVDLPHYSLNKLYLFLSRLFGSIYGWLITAIEKNLFLLPLPLHTKLINIYRNATGALK
jgi:hypothetical protein